MDNIRCMICSRRRILISSGNYRLRVKIGREASVWPMETSIWNVVLTAFKVDVILFVADEECMNRLHSYAETRFHGLNDDYRRYIATIESEKIRKEYDSIVSDGDPVSKHNFRLPETIQVLMRLVVRNTEIIFLSVKRLELQS